ncbi:hypothetical protein CH333_03955 [candidate division WOR-3 bacterium JGI_Cruoil_03_44_89]|uniref:TonB-dependent receptor plug domain-containing protein n=1 Tax=candidate division WOR-3 bacterium JGI_Cruoil_03_44_89 TaxID=1973748 RepID=A0A235BVF3_UNCW3|nr:MAG: hypothetical protein CH333_03955 [candidate division WOR-3 bacterium JGI_Cruoil_03_44_89]
MSFLFLCANIIIFLSTPNPDTTKPIVDTLHYSMETIEWEAFPVHTVRDILILQPGVVDCGGDLHIRGGFAENIEYWLDGVPLFITNLPLESVRKVYITKNPTSARYGRSNVVEIEMKERGKFGRWSTGFDEGMNTYELNIGGTLYDKIGYSLMGYTKSRDYERSYIFDLSNTDMDLYYLVGRMSYDVSPSTNIGIGLINVRGQGGLYTTFLGLPWAGAERGDNGEKYNPDWLRSSWLEKGKQFYAYFQHKSNNISCNIRYMHYTQHEIIGERNLEFDEKKHFYEDIKFEPWWMYAYHPQEYLPAGWDEKDENGEYIYPHGVPYIFRFGSPGLWHEVKRNINLLNADLETELTDWAALSIGGEIKKYEIGKDMADYIYVMPAMDSVTSGGDTIRVVRPEYRDIKYNLYWEKYERTPEWWNCWLDLTLHKGKITLTSGISVDYYNPRTWKYRDPLRPLNPDRTPDTVTAESDWGINLNIYLTYIFTNKILIGLGYNQFHLNASHLFNLNSINFYPFDYAINFTPFNYTVRENTILGLSQVKQFEARGIYYPVDGVSLTLSIFRKEMYNLPKSVFLPASPEPYWTYQLESYGSADGMEMALYYYSTWGILCYSAYTLQNSRLNTNLASYFYPGTFQYLMAGPIRYEKPPSPWDRHHNIISLIAKKIDKGWSIGKLNPFEDLTLSAVFKANSGLPYTKTDKFGNILGEINAERMGWNYVTDLKVTKGVKVSGLNLSVFLEVTNLFNTKNVLNVYPYTGKPDNNEMLCNYEDYIEGTFPITYIEEGKIPVGTYGSADERRDLDGDGFITTDEWYESYVNAYTDYMNDPFNYGPPRKIGIGVQLEW